MFFSTVCSANFLKDVADLQLFILVKLCYIHSCSPFKNPITPQQSFCYDYSDSQKACSWVEIDLILHLNKPRDAGSGNCMLDVMNIAGPSGTNKQLPKPLPLPQPLLSSMNLQREKTSLKYFSPLFLSLVYGLKVEWDPVTCVTLNFSSMWGFLFFAYVCLYNVIRIEEEEGFGLGFSSVLILENSNGQSWQFRSSIE